MPLSARLLRPRASGAGFDPRSIANCAFWLDASVDSSLTFNGNSVSEWRDLSGNGRNFPQATAANQPDGVGRTQNGRRVLDFAGNQSLDGNAATLNTLRNVSGATVVCVYKIDVAASRAVVHFARGSSGANIARFQIGGDGTNNRLGGRRLDADSFATTTPYTASTNAVVQSGVIDYANADAFYWENGTLRASNTSFQTAGNSDDSNHLAVVIGANFPNAVDYKLDGWIGEVLVWPRALSSTERQAVERYLGAKWGIAVT
jgi:hypothetical protein